MIFEELNTFYKYCIDSAPTVCEYHIHRHVEIVYIERGGVEACIGGKDYSLREGEMALIFPYIPHSFHLLLQDNMEEIRKNNLLHFVLCGLDLLPLQSEFMLGTRPDNPLFLPEQLHEDIVYALKQLQDINYTDQNRGLVGALYSLCLCRLLSSVERFSQRDRGDLDLACAIFPYLEDHYQEDLTLASVSKHFGIGKYQLSRLFTSVTDVGFSSYINSLRIDHSRDLLTNSRLPISAIAWECGFKNQQTFNRVFRECCDCTPSQYRNALPY